MKKIFCVLFILVVLVMSFRVGYSETVVVGAKVNHRVEPVGIENGKPVFRWNLDDSVRNTFQKSYRLVVASSVELLDEKPDFWDSGWIESSDCIEIEYAGKVLSSSQKYFWNVHVKNNRNEISKLNQPAIFVTGIFDNKQWKAKWITMKRENAEPLPIFRKSFHVAQNSKTVKTAFVHICGLGHYELRLNGMKVGQSFIDPGWTNYRKTCLYSSYDVTSRLRGGENVFGVLLGNGMYNVAGGRYTKFKGSFGLPKLIAQLEITYNDGTSETVATDESWQCSLGAITFSCVYGGEDFDATRLENGWDSPKFNVAQNTRWQPAILAEPPEGTLRAQEAPPIIVAETLKPVSVTRLKNGHYLADFGYNFSGRPRIWLRGSAGSKVTVRTGELANRIWQGHSYTYTLAGNGRNLPLENAGDLSYNNQTDKELELILPKFSYFGFQFLQIEGVVREEDRTDVDKGLPELVGVAADFTTSASAKAGEFHCSNEMFNEIDAMIERSVRSNLQSVLTDCPHREKLGWLEVAHLMSPSIMSRFDVQNLYRKICRDTTESQLDNGLVPDIAPEYTRFKGGFFESPEWGSSAVLIPYILSQVYGDREIVARQRETMKRYIDYLASTRNDQGLVKAGLGDWYDWTPAKGHA
ncbi:MAG: family 78 glycoside hydrolase catalytic domain, partial [Planctomycetaceae bacterium]|nr:family 78 glycoside hydrolase catalytic domain [Planctomycetaceae bacterium]